MIGVIQRDKACRVFRGGEDPGGILDPDQRVAGGVQHQKRPVQVGDGRGKLFRADIFDKALADRDLAPAKHDLAGAVGLDPFQRVAEIMRHMAGVEGGGDGDDGLDTVHIRGRAQHRRAAK